MSPANVRAACDGMMVQNSFVDWLPVPLASVRAAHDGLMVRNSSVERLLEPPATV